jgi:hypothetical protein
MRYKHGMIHTPEWQAWVNMLARCRRIRHPSFKNYGGRGISICEEWATDFRAFLRDVGKRPSAAHSLDRFPDNNGNYEPGNVRWATRKDQAQNTRHNHWIEIDGVSKPLVEWARDKGLSDTTIIHRMKRGMSPREAVMTPPAEMGRRISKRKEAA